MNDKNLLSPEERAIAEWLAAAAEQVDAAPSFKAELETQLMNALKPKSNFFRTLVPALGWAVGLIALTLIANWLIRSIAPQPPQPAAGGTPLPSQEAPLPDETLPAPASEAYDWHGTTLYLQADLPASPAEASVYLYQPEQRATLESVRALAAQFGMDGQIYQTPPELGGSDTTDFLVVDGNQRLHVRSDQYFQFYTDYPRWNATIHGATPPPDAEAQIDQFLKAHGFDFPHRIWPSEMYGDFIALPLTPDGLPVCYEYFKCAGLRFTLDEKGILAVDGALPKYEKIGQYGVISAEEALQKILNPALMSDPTAATGMMEGFHSPIPPIPTWQRPRPTDQTITIFGWLSSVPSLEGGAPLVTLDGYTVTGNTAGVPASMDSAFVEAIGQIHDQNSVQTFELESWKSRDGYEDGLLGTIERQGEQVVLNTLEGETLLLPDVPSNLPLPLENAFVIGVRQGEAFEWKSIDLRQTLGGGGGGGLGFYKLNLTGTPVPFPTPEPPSRPTSGEGAAYVVQAGDTCRSIADAFSMSAEDLTALNNLPADCSTLAIGQTLVIPGAAQSEPQKVEVMRGLLSITIYKKPDGSQRVEYGFVSNTDPYPYLLLEGANLEALQAYQNRPVDVWGTANYDPNRAPILKVERYEIPFPDLQFQILRGRQKMVTLEGQPATLFTATDGQTYVQFAPGGGVDGSTVGNEGDEVLLEALIIPGETFGGYPALRVFSASMAVNPKNGQPMEMPITADQIYAYDEAALGASVPPTATIERIELVYYMPDPRYLTGELSPDQRYLQPAWLFVGHYSSGEEFFILVQALKQEFLLPEVAPYTPPG